MIRLRFLILLSGLAAGLVAASAQTPAPPASAPAVQKSEREKELQLLKRDIDASREREAALKSEIDAIRNDRALLNKALIDSAAKIRATETKLAATEARLVPLEKREAEIRKSLGERRAVLSEVLAAMQRISASPPPALLLEPESALQSARAALLLGAVVPELRGQAEKLVADLSELARVRSEIKGERETIAQDRASLAGERARIAALIDERQRQFGESQKALDSERARSAALAKRAETIQDLVTGLEKEIADAAARAAKVEPSVPFGETRGKLPLPVAGNVLRAFGADNGAGGTEKGVFVAVRPGTEVNSPCPGRVVFAGTFRNYGQLLIINAGGGYHILLAGMESITVDLGQVVVAGEPVAVMGNGAKVSAVSALGSTGPILYIEFRKDGISIDPAPWWATTVNEKARG